MSIRESVLITGASSGIGKEFALIFAKNNYNLILVARRKNILEDIAKKIMNEHSIQVMVIAKDLLQPDAAKEIYSELQEKNITVDVLVNNAGFGVWGKFSSSNLNSTLDMIKVNITTLTELTHLFLPAMLKQKKGRIMNVASTAAFQSGPNMAVYCASKAYVLSFSEALSCEMKNSGVTVTSLCPGATTTEFQELAKMTHTRILKNSFSLMDAKTVAEIGFYAILRGKSVVVTGVLNKVFAFSARIVPRSMATKIAGFLMQ